MAERPMALSFIQLITPSLSLLQIMAYNNNDKHKMEEAESSTARKWLQLFDDDDSDDDSSDSFNSLEREPDETEEEVSSEEMSMNQLDTSEEKLYDKRARGILFSDNGDTPSTSSKPCTSESHRRSDQESSDEDDDDDDNDFWM
jgi:hypothetical protein